MTIEEGQIISDSAIRGGFYPEDKNQLSLIIDGFLNKAEPIVSKEDIFALIVPHAGYQFSGQTAAYAYKNLIGRKIETVVLIGVSHQSYFEGISIVSGGCFETPLGRVEIDEKLAKSIMDSYPGLFLEGIGQKEEHSLMVQLPFLQKALGRFKAVPLLFGVSGEESYRFLAEVLAGAVKENNLLFIASSDLSHYPPVKETERSDKRTVRAILSGETSFLEKEIVSMLKENIANQLTFACGLEAIKTIMALSRKTDSKKAILLNYSHSGMISGDNSRVVGYASIAFLREKSGFELNETEKKALLRIAGLSVKSFVLKKKPPGLKTKSKLLKKKLGAFVTIKKKGALRGCIGCFTPSVEPLINTVAKMAIEAASDPRFEPITPNELKELEYEISVLGPLEKISDWRDIKLGKEGVTIRLGAKSGVFLPQVAKETGWNREEFLNELCLRKAGLPKEAWRNPETEIYVFNVCFF